MNMKLDNMMLTKQKFSKMVEQTYKTKTNSYLDAILYVCEDLNLEVEDVKKYVSPAIKTILEAEAVKLNMMSEKDNSINLE